MILELLLTKGVNEVCPGKMAELRGLVELQVVELCGTDRIN